MPKDKLNSQNISGTFGVSEEKGQQFLDAFSNGALTSQTLAPAKSLTLPPPVTSTAGTGLQGMLETQATTFTEGLAAQTQQRASNTSSSFDALMSSIQDSQGQAQLQSKADKTLAPLESELQDINNQLLQEQEGLRRRLEALDKNPQGMETSALESEKRRVEQDSLRTQADLSVIQLAKQGKFDSAKAIADRAIQAQLEEQTKRTDMLRFIYSENKDLFTKSEQREFEVAQGDRERALNQEEYMLRSRFDQMIRESDPLYAAQLQKAYQEIEQGRIEQLGLDPKAQLKIQGRVAKSEVVIGKVNEALGQVGRSTSGFIGGVSRFVPGSNAYNLNRTLDTIKANLGFDELQAMRDASPTGGALGQVAVQELAMLQSTIASLDTGLDQQTLRNNLNQITEHYRNWLNTVGYDVAPDGTVIQIID